MSSVCPGRSVSTSFLSLRGPKNGVNPNCANQEVAAIFRAEGNSLCLPFYADCIIIVRRHGQNDIGELT